MLEAHNLGSWAETNLRSIKAEHIYGEADALSRSTVDHSKWQLDPILFREISNRFGQPQFDLFASLNNSQLPRYFTRYPSPRGRGNGCSLQQMAQGVAVRIPPTPTDSGNHPQVASGASGDHLGCSTLAEMTVVCLPHGTLNLIAMEDPSRPYLPQPGGPSAPGSPMAPVGHLALEWRTLARQSYLSRVISMIQASRRPSTNRIYDATWRNFCLWCTGHQLQPLSVTIPNILDYLLEGIDKGLTPNIIRRQVAALSTVLTCDNLVPLAQHPVVSAFLKGVTNARPPTIHRYPSWDLPQVLQALILPPFEPIRSCSLRLLSLKVAFLIAITSARRILELAALSVGSDLCTFYEDRVVLRLDPSCIPKVNTWFHRTQELVLPNFCPNPAHRLERQWHKLDVGRALRYYVK
ncbi:uncharacterized protein LOC120296645 [Crotalus tigris]|uniref:uncharacterized protein LOC120296645 n=1 Tax=Crotalus tigris TaxID=88082 RepID=UPI00192F1223|nr:uncharacterized protein LOC120296645 [Crotalus tigris]